MTLEQGTLAISVELCPTVCEGQPHVRRPSQTYLAAQPQDCASFRLDQPEWCAQPQNLVTLEELSTSTVFNVGDKPFYIIGRNERADIVLDSLYVSRRHAALLHHTNGSSYIMDLGSVHGTYLGKERLIPYVPTLIRSGVLIQFGTCRRQFLLKECPTMEHVLQEAQEHGSGDDRDLRINTQLNCFLSYQETDALAVISRQSIFRRDTLEHLTFVCDNPACAATLGSRSRCQSGDSESGCGPHNPARKRVRFHEETEDSASSASSDDTQSSDSRGPA